MNGSSITGHCSSVKYIVNQATCAQPTTSVLFDGVIPTLIGINCDMWASQLLTLQKTVTEVDFTAITFDFPGYAGINGRIEIVMFNCPQWGISVQSIDIIVAPSFTEGTTLIATHIPSNTSCDSLVTICIPYISTNLTVFGLLFTFGTNSSWMHLAELTVYQNGTSCDTSPRRPPPPPTCACTSSSSTTIPTPTSTLTTSHSAG